MLAFPCVSPSPAASLLPWLFFFFLLFYTTWLWSCLPLLQDFLTTFVHFYQAVQTWLGALELKSNREWGSELAVKELESFNFLTSEICQAEKGMWRQLTQSWLSKKQTCRRTETARYLQLISFLTLSQWRTDFPFTCSLRNNSGNSSRCLMEAGDTGMQSHSISHTCSVMKNASP